MREDETGDRPCGRIVGISGSVVRAETTSPVSMGEVVRVGEDRLAGEVIALEGNRATAQVYEETAGLAAGDPFFATGSPLTVELGPGLLGSVLDGLARPLAALAAAEGDFLGRGRSLPALDRDRAWGFEPRVAPGASVVAGSLLGVVPETRAIEHRVLVPPGIAGRLLEIAPTGSRRVADSVARIETATGTVTLPLFQRWKVRAPRPFAEALPLSIPLLTGQRVLDTFFPLPRGGAAGMPGGFGTGKTITQQQLCKWMRADVIVFVGCGERGNEMAQVLHELPELADPRTGWTLAERTVLLANTSNMPVAAREASLYTAVTIAEYYRDMGYHVAVLADSTSRWAEALREISGRLEEMPAEEGYPAYLATRLAAFYERAGRVRTLSAAEGSVSIVSAISPPGGDLTEPVTRHTRRFTRCFWSLDPRRAEARIFPAIGLEESSGDASPAVRSWWEAETVPEWGRLRREAIALLEKAAQLERMARLVGTESLPERERFALRMGSLFQEGYLAQNAFEPKDASCSPARQARLLRLLLRVRDLGLEAIERGATSREIEAMPVLSRIERAKEEIGDDELPRLADLETELEAAFSSLPVALSSPEARAEAG
ncbi:MAG TPA: V-type ATP synthase subunit A [Thermoanaerobaculia bacterium]